MTTYRTSRSLDGPLEYAKRICYSSEETLMFSYEMGLKFKYSHGVYIECGVAAGAQIIAMACAAPDKGIYAFDSFQGIPLPSNKDDQYPGIRHIDKEEQCALPDPGSQELKSSGATVHSLSNFWENVRKSGISGRNIITVSGWFEETLPMPVTPDIAILRLDGDLYNSTMVCLTHLFHKVIPGGVVIIDDWQLPGCQQACKDFFGSIGYMPDIQYVSNIAYFFK